MLKFCIIIDPLKSSENSFQTDIKTCKHCIVVTLRVERDYCKNRQISKLTKTQLPKTYFCLPASFFKV